MNNSSTRQNWIRFVFIILLVAPATLMTFDQLIWGIYKPGWMRNILHLGLIVYFLAAVVGSFIFIFLEFRKNMALAFLPIILNAFLFYAFFNFDLPAFSRNQDFRRNLEAREEVVEMVKSGKLRPVKGDSVKLSDKYKYLSRWGMEGGVYVSEETDSVFFATWYTNATLDFNYSGFMYTKEKSPSKNDFDRVFTPDKYTEVIKMKDHWTWIEN